jgi:putative phosphoribosyl transferase
MFKDRWEAGRALAAKLAPLITRSSVVVAAIPRGGVTVALPIVERLGSVPLTVVYARKLTAPVAAELAFGALDEDGHATLDEETVRLLGLTPKDVEEAKARVAAEIRRRMALYRVPPLAHYLPGRDVVLVDDGLATGLTMRAAVAYARRHGAGEVTVAAPCASTQAAARFSLEADRLVTLIVDEAFEAVGAYYVDFAPVLDEQVNDMLARALEHVPAALDSSLRVSFKNSRGISLAGVLLVPPAAGPHPVVVFAHGWGSGKDSPRNRAAAEALRGAGIAAFLFDFTGHGESEGTPEQSTAAQQVDDLRAACEIVRTLDEVDANHIGVVGASSGAMAALSLATESPRVAALVLRSAAVEGAEDAAARVTVPTLLVVGEHDRPVRLANQRLLGRLGGVHRLEVVAGGDHLFENAEARRRATALTVAWFEEHLPRIRRGRMGGVPGGL